ncbi:MAG: DRTGG domain-containing protein [Bacteroidales bacterium]
MEITVKELADRLQLKCVSGCDNLHRKVSGVYVSDLLSDVVGHAEELHLWMTLHTHPNIVAVATLKNLAAIVITGGRTPDPDTVQAGNTHQIPILVSSLTTFQLAGQIFQLISQKA